MHVSLTECIYSLFNYSDYLFIALISCHNQNLLTVDLLLCSVVTTMEFLTLIPYQKHIDTMFDIMKLRI